MDETTGVRMPWFGRWWANVVAVGAIWAVAVIVVALLALALVFVSGGFAGTGVWADPHPLCDPPTTNCRG